MKKLKKYSKTFKLLMILGMFLNMLMPTGGMTVAAGDGARTTSNTITDKLLTNFELTIIDNDNKQTKVESGEELELDIEKMNAVGLVYTLVKPVDVVVLEGDTYTIDLPSIFKGAEVSGKKLADDTHGVLGTYAITGKQLVVTFTENANIDDVKIFVNISGEFNKEIFEKEEEVEVEVPYAEGESYSVTIKAKKGKYVGEDKKEAGKPYVINEDGTKTEVDRNPTHIDWTVRVNDNMGSFGNAKIIDDLGDNLEIVEGSFKVERIMRN